MSWDEIREQEGAVRLLERAIAGDRIAPAYLFVGPPSVGKGLTARVFAQALNCERGWGVACGACAACHTIRSGNHPDVLWARPEKRSRTISVETARGTTQALGLAPQLGRYRVAVFDDADCLNLPAQNALLKTLEEPPTRSLVVLVSATPEGLLPTVRSRCQLVRFRPLPPETVAGILQTEGIAGASARSAAAAGQGGVAVARMLADADRLAYMRARIAQALAGEAAAAAADHARDLDAREKRLEKNLAISELDPELLTKEQRKQLEQERLARVQLEMAEHVEADLRLLALAIRDGLARQASGGTGLCLMGEPLGPLAEAAPTALANTLREIDRGLAYLRQFIRRERVLFDVYGAVAAIGAETGV